MGDFGQRPPGPYDLDQCLDERGIIVLDATKQGVEDELLPILDLGRFIGVLAATVELYVEMTVSPGPAAVCTRSRLTGTLKRADVSVHKSPTQVCALRTGERERESRD